jgi:polyhydroxybutyrate depolymerase
MTSKLDGGAGGGINMCAGGPVGFARPADVRTFASYDCMVPAPLVILLHDYASSGAQAEATFDLAAQADAMGFLYVHPDGTKDAMGNEFWNATDACCNTGGSQVDDSTYLSDLITDIQAQYNVDAKRIYLFGHGNGGFMAYRMACDHATQITAVASLGGAMWADTTQCKPKTAVSVIEIHGTADMTFQYGGGTNLGKAYPSAATTEADWAKIDKCSGAPAMLPPLDLDASLAGAETTVTRQSPCFAGSAVALWTIQGGAHTPKPSATFASSVLGALLANKRP